MVRPTKCRLITQEPNIDYFKPRGIPLIELEEISLGLDEFEALRLADLNGLHQEDAARQMRISRATFGNILTEAHAKIADAIINGKAIRIEGGIYKMRTRRRRRACCRHGQQLPRQNSLSAENTAAPKLGLAPKRLKRGPAGHGRCRRRGR